MGILGMNSIRSTYSIMEEESQCCLVRRQRSPSLLYSRLFSHSSSLFRECCVWKTNTPLFSYKITTMKIFLTNFLVKLILRNVIVIFCIYYCFKCRSCIMNSKSISKRTISCTVHIFALIILRYT